MARSVGFGQFAKRMKVVAQGVTENVTLGVRKAALVADQVAVNETPVDTGRARANWIPSIGAPSGRTVDEPVTGDGHASEVFAVLNAVNLVSKWKAGSGHSIFFTNNLPYIERLDDGYSPQGSDMTGKAVRAAQQVLKQHKLLKGV